MASSTVAAVPIEPAAPLLAAPRRHSTVGWQIASGIRRNHRYGRAQVGLQLFRKPRALQ